MVLVCGSIDNILARPIWLISYSNRLSVYVLLLSTRTILLSLDASVRGLESPEARMNVTAPQITNLSFLYLSFLQQDLLQAPRPLTSSNAGPCSQETGIWKI